MATRTLDLVRAAEGHGIRFEVRQGRVLMFFEEGRQELKPMVVELRRRRVSVRRYILKRDGADPRVLIETWNDDPTLARDFPGGMAEFAEFAEAEAARLLQAWRNWRSRWENSRVGDKKGEGGVGAR